MDEVAPFARPTVAVIGGGFSGSFFALACADRRPDLDVVLVEVSARPGPGLAYGRCAPDHLLNVPVHRMELGLSPSFSDFLAARPDTVRDALAEAGGDLSQAYVPRALFGAYMAERVEAALDRGAFRRLRGEAVRVAGGPRHRIHLSDGRSFPADQVVLATGNLPPRPPRCADPWLYDSPFFVPDPWAADAFEGLDPDAPLVLVGTGLTMVDVALKLEREGHRGPLVAVSRHGLLPCRHEAGGAWPPFAPEGRIAPRLLMAILRAEAARARAAGVPWQRVMDTLRPSIGRIWAGWDLPERARFLRHLRTLWDVHRHRMAPAVARRVSALITEGRLSVLAGRIAGFARAGAGVRVDVALRGGRHRALAAARVVNCTGPRSDFGRLDIALFADLRARGHLVPDPLGLGIETRDCALVDRDGLPARTLFAIGPLARPAWWEVTAVPEIAAQVLGLVDLLATAGRDGSRWHRFEPGLAERFQDLGAGI